MEYHLLFIPKKFKNSVFSVDDIYRRKINTILTMLLQLSLIKSFPSIEFKFK